MNTSNLDWCYTAFILAAIAWIIFAHPPRGLSRAQYRRWYHDVYLTGWYWTNFSHLRRMAGFFICADWYKFWLGPCGGAITVHHKKWAYRWKYWEWLPHVFFFGTVPLCWHHHDKRHEG